MSSNESKKGTVQGSTSLPQLQLPPGYELERRLGVGSFGSIVVVARQPPHHQKVAVKTIDKRQWKADDACGGLSAIKQEAQALKELSGHPNIIGFIDAVETDDYYHLITQHNSGGDLYEHLYETTYTFTEEDIMSEDEWGDDMDQSITPRGCRTLFLNEREPSVPDNTDNAVIDDNGQMGGHDAGVRRRERQGMHQGPVGESPRGHNSLGQHSPRRIVEMKEYGGRLSDQEAQPLFRQLVRALQYCHSHGIAHRDLKPENVFLDDNQTVLLADFGLCMHFTPDQRRFVPCCGSILYTAPEIIKQLPYVGPEIDIWGLGILLYEMLCGCTPFQADTDEATQQRVLSGAVTFPDHLSSQARALISGMLQVDPALRLDLAAIRKHPWNLHALQQPATSYLSPRGLISPRMLLNRNRASAVSSTASSSPKPFSLNLSAALTPSRTIPSPRYDTTSPRRMAVPRPLVNPDNADCLIAIPGGADCEMPTRPRAPSLTSPRGPPSQLRARPALWHSPQLCSPDPSPRGPGGTGAGLVSPRSFLSATASASLLSPRSRLSPGSPRESPAASKIYYSLMTMEEERKLPRRARLASGAPNSSGTEEEEEESDRTNAEGAESDTDDESDYSESDGDDVDVSNTEERAGGVGGSPSIQVPSSNKATSENEARDSIRERLKIGRIDLSLVKEPTTVARPLPTVVVVGEGEMADVCKAVMPDDTQTTKHHQDNTKGKPVKKEASRGLKKKKERPNRDRLQDPHAPLYSAQSPLESPRAHEGRTRSSSFGAARDKGTVVDFVTTIRNRSKQPQGKPVVFVLCALVALALAQQPSPPLWDQTFKFVASVQYQPTIAATQSMQYHYRWDIPAVAQVITNELGQTFTILNVKNNTWRVTPGNRTCCLCTNPYACGHVTPPAPDWLQRGNDTKYLGVTSINERDCHGWAKSNPAAVFGWWTSVKTGTPCQLSWLLGMTINMVMASYTNDPALVPSDVFDIPSYCPYHETDPNCSISSF